MIFDAVAAANGLNPKKLAPAVCGNKLLVEVCWNSVFIFVIWLCLSWKKKDLEFLKCCFDGITNLNSNSIIGEEMAFSISISLFI
jgi:hypothetical protein